MTPAVRPQHASELCIIDCADLLLRIRCADAFEPGRETRAVGTSARAPPNEGAFEAPGTVAG
jgi:hypothetical protein